MFLDAEVMFNRLFFNLYSNDCMVGTQNIQKTWHSVIKNDIIKHML